MRIGYRTQEVPTRRGTGAFAPIPAQSWSATFNGQNITTGCPGTVPVASPRPPSLNDGELGGPFNQPSNVSPNVFYPSVYVAHANPTMHFAGAILQSVDHVVPVPATQPAKIVMQFMHRWRIGGRTVTTSVRPFTQWPNYSGGTT